MKLEELERRLRTDIMQEAIAWAGRVMLHKEVSLDTPAAREINFEEAARPSMSFTSAHLPHEPTMTFCEIVQNGRFFCFSQPLHTINWCHVGKSLMHCIIPEKLILDVQASTSLAERKQ